MRAIMARIAGRYVARHVARAVLREARTLPAEFEFRDFGNADGVHGRSRCDRPLYVVGGDAARVSGRCRSAARRPTSSPSIMARSACDDWRPAGRSILPRGPDDIRNESSVRHLVTIARRASRRWAKQASGSWARPAPWSAAAAALGSVVAETLVRAGVGFVRIVDRDFLELNNLQRQVLYDEQDVADGLPKAIAAANKLRRINSEIEIEPVVADVTHHNIARTGGRRGCDRRRHRQLRDAVLAQRFCREARQAVGLRRLHRRRRAVDDDSARRNGLPGLPDGRRAAARHDAHCDTAGILARSWRHRVDRSGRSAEDSQRPSRGGQPPADDHRPVGQPGSRMSTCRDCATAATAACASIANSPG